MRKENSETLRFADPLELGCSLNFFGDQGKNIMGDAR